MQFDIDGATQWALCDPVVHTFAGSTFVAGDEVVATIEKNETGNFEVKGKVTKVITEATKSNHTPTVAAPVEKKPFVPYGSKTPAERLEIRSLALLKATSEAVTSLTGTLGTPEELEGAMIKIYNTFDGILPKP